MVGVWALGTFRAHACQADDPCYGLQMPGPGWFQCSIYLSLSGNCMAPEVIEIRPLDEFHSHCCFDTRAVCWQLKSSVYVLGGRNTGRDAMVIWEEGSL